MRFSKLGALLLVAVGIAAGLTILPGAAPASEASTAWLPTLQIAAGLGSLGFMACIARRGTTLGRTSEPERDVFPTALVDQAGVRAVDVAVRESVDASRRHGRTVGLVYLNLDCFDRLRATNGLDTANRAMRELAALTRANVRAYDTVLRMDGDEFVVCLAHLRTAEDLRSVADRLTAFLTAIRVLGLPEHLTPAVGTALCPAGGTTGADLLASARTAAADTHVGAMPRATDIEDVARRVACVETRARSLDDGAATSRPRAGTRSNLRLVTAGGAER